MGRRKTENEKGKRTETERVTEIGGERGRKNGRE